MSEAECAAANVPHPDDVPGWRRPRVILGEAPAIVKVNDGVCRIHAGTKGLSDTNPPTGHVALGESGQLSAMRPHRIPGRLSGMGSDGFESGESVFPFGADQDCRHCADPFVAGTPSRARD